MIRITVRSKEQELEKSAEMPNATLRADVCEFGDDAEYRFVTIWKDRAFVAQVPIHGTLEIEAI